MREPRGAPAEALEVSFSRLVEDYLYSRAKPPTLAPDLRTLTLNQLVTVVERLGTLAATPADDDRPVSRDALRYNLSDSRHSGGVAAAAPKTTAAMEVLSTWPDRYHELLVGLIDRNPNPVQRNVLRRRFATEMGLLAINPLRDHDGLQIEPLTSELKRFCLEHLDYTWGQRRHFSPARNSVARRLAEIASRKGALQEPQRASFNSQIPVSNLYMSIEDAMHRLEGNAHASIVPWFQAGLLTRKAGRIFIIERMEVAELEKRLGEIVIQSEISPDLVRIDDLASKKTPNTRPELLRDIFDGHISVYGLNPGAPIQSLYVDRADLRARRSRFRLIRLIESGAYVTLAKVNSDFEALWGPMASLGPIEARQWVARGRLRHRYGTPTAGKTPSQSYFYNSVDLVRITQSMFRPLYFPDDAYSAV